MKRIRILSLLLAAVLCLCLLPFGVWAEEESPAAEDFEPAVTVVIPEPEPPAPAVEPEPETPAEPAEPDTPAEPAEPDTPDDPAEPDTTAEPADPGTPTDDPADPGTPSDGPADPADPDAPADDPDDPAGSDTPSDHGDIPIPPDQPDFDPITDPYEPDDDEEHGPPPPGNTYVINGVSVSYTDFPSAPYGCWTYANNLYTKIWGQAFDSEFYSPDNMLRELSDEELTLTVEHLKEYVTNSAPGATLRVCEECYLHGTDGWGHSVLIVDWDENGLTVLQGGFQEYPYCYESYYKWEDFVWAYVEVKGYLYIKYIKWPDAIPYYFCDVTFDPNGGECDTEGTTVRAVLPLGKLPTPELPGWLFNGWYDAPEGGERYEKTSAVKRDTTLYAHWIREHDWGDWIRTKAPTYTEPGEEYRVCFTCCEKETRVVPVLAPTIKMAERAKQNDDPLGRGRAISETSFETEL